MPDYTLSSVISRARLLLGGKQAAIWLSRYLPEINGVPLEVAKTEPGRVLRVLAKIENGVY